MINKSASLIGTIEFKNGNRNTIYIGHNHNTGETIVWQQVAGRRSQRITGKNITKFAAELDSTMNEGDAKWIGERNDSALNCLAKFIPAA